MYKGLFLLKLYFVLDYDFEWIVLFILNLDLCSFIWCFYWMFFSSIKGINRLISKEMSPIYLKITIRKNDFLKTLIF